MNNEITIGEILRAGRKRWGDEHIVAHITTDGLIAEAWLFAENADRTLRPLACANSLSELLRMIESGESVEVIQ